MSAEVDRYYLAGAHNPVPDSLHYRASDPELEKALKLYLKDLGKMTERGALGIWSGLVHPAPQITCELKSSFDHIVNQTTSSFRHPPNDVTRAYQIICRENPQHPQEPADPSLLCLVNLVDAACELKFKDLYSQLNSVDQGDGVKDLKDYRARHWLEATLAVARQYLDPLQFPCVGQFLPDVHPNGGNYGQFDGLIVSQKFTGRIDWIRPPIYYPVEIKVPFRLDDIRYPTRRVSEQNKHLHQMQQRLGQIALKQSGSGVEPHFPTSAYFAYLRGSTPPSIWSVDLNSSFFERWVESLDLDISHLATLPKEHQDSAMNLIRLLQHQAQKLINIEAAEAAERARIKIEKDAIQDLSHLVPGMLDPLFTNPLSPTEKTRHRHSARKSQK